MHEHISEPSEHLNRIVSSVSRNDLKSMHSTSGNDCGVKRLRFCHILKDAVKILQIYTPLLGRIHSALVRLKSIYTEAPWYN